MFLSNSQNTSRYYNYDWALTTYRQFQRSYTRATKLFFKTHRIGENTVISWLSSDQQKWERFKMIVKRIEKWDKMHHAQTIEEYDRHLLSTIYYVLSNSFSFYDAKRAYCLDAGIPSLV